MYQIHRASPEAIAKCPEGFETKPDAFRPLPNLGKATKYPIRRLAVGTCFVIPYAEAKLGILSSVRAVASNANRVMAPNRYVVITHENEQLIEVARIL